MLIELEELFLLALFQSARLEFTKFLVDEVSAC